MNFILSVKVGCVYNLSDEMQVLAVCPDYETSIYVRVAVLNHRLNHDVPINWDLELSSSYFQWSLREHLTTDQIHSRAPLSIYLATLGMTV